MRIVRDTKGNILYRITDNKIVSEIAVDMKSMLKIVKEEKLIVNRGRRD